MLSIISENFLNPSIKELRRVSFSVRSLVAREPTLWLFYQPYLWWGQIKRKCANHDLHEGILLPETELVIDGFQGSANSYAVSAFKNSQIRHVKLMHHRHAPVLIIKAIQQEVPVLLTIREPVGTALSVASRWPHISVSQVLSSYIGFYTKLKPYRFNCVVSTFELTTQHLDIVIRAVNEKFGVDFAPIDITAAHLSREKSVEESSSGTNRQATKQQKQKELELDKNIHLLAQAKALYQEFESCAKEIASL